MTVTGPTADAMKRSQVDNPNWGVSSRKIFLTLAHLSLARHPVLTGPTPPCRHESKTQTQPLINLYLSPRNDYGDAMSKHQVLIVEDDPDLAAALVEQVGTGGYAATAVSTLDAARDALAGSSSFDLMLLDIGLPDGDGNSLCADLRRDGYNLPVIILSGRTEEDDVVHSLDNGADAYMRKPLHPAELMARLQHLLPNPA